MLKLTTKNFLKCSFYNFLECQYVFDFRACTITIIENLKILARWKNCMNNSINALQYHSKYIVTIKIFHTFHLFAWCDECKTLENIIIFTLCPATSIHWLDDTGKDSLSKLAVETICRISFDLGPWSDNIPYSLERSSNLTSFSGNPSRWFFEKSCILCWICAKLW